MNTNEKHEVIALFARRSLVLLGLLFAALCFAGPSRAQSTAPPAPPPTAKPTAATTPRAQTPPATSPSQGTATTAKPAAPSEVKSSLSSKGPHEGIAVHGHWTIEVRNPDGTVVTHREFENAITTSGADLLTGMLSGEYVPGGFYVYLGGTFGLMRFMDTRNAALCPASSASTGLCGTLTYAPNRPTGTPTLGYTLTGNYLQAPNSGTINTVASGLYECSSGTVITSSTAFYYASPLTCGSTFPNEFEDFTSANIATLGISVIANQSVSVTVVITFSSPT